MDFIEDISPHELHHAAIPNKTIDFWERRDLLALGVLTSFVRHSSGYGITLTKLTARCPGQGKTVLSKAYNRLIEERFLVRIEFTYARPAGSNERSGLRYTKHAVSRVQISEQLFAELVKSHAPGKHIFIPYGEPDENGRRETRRVKILAAELYCHVGAGQVTSETRLMPHPRRRGAPVKEPAKRPQPVRLRLANSVDASLFDAPSEYPDIQESSLVTPEVGKLTSGTTRAATTDPLVTPDVENPMSGVTSGNTPEHQVAPDVEDSTSIKKYQVHEVTDLEDRQAGGETPPPDPAFRSSDSPAEGGTDQGDLETQPQYAHAQPPDAIADLVQLGDERDRLITDVERLSGRQAFQAARQLVACEIELRRLVPHSRGDTSDNLQDLTLLEPVGRRGRSRR
ncbi:hypothetical protein BS329_15600 [Amycolatopsis coloradensis]|uniref:Uncharacterized protein n=1 Tax=Amycolatopsis coloradensis TaxID=76021 RepID=A0A1R0KU91_9PSEU|nr:hypothetical protein [Amycolatopsis coloradensis]OLZ51688.1 hypothetical protein BS329_15600 [Amycolatopsis coloradensis]